MAPDHRSPRPSRRPSARWGLREALRLWRLVLACWVVSWAAIAPALLLVRRMVFPALVVLPRDPAAVPPGDVALILLEAARTAAAPLGLAVASAALVLWAWTVLWHAGVVAWHLWTGGRRVRLGEVLGLGMVAWWRYARLSMTALAVLAGAAAALWIPLWAGVERAFATMAEERLIWLLVGGAGATKLVAIVVWLATLHGAWLLGLPKRRSAVLAWLRGLGSALGTPLSSLWAWLVWLVPALAVSAVPTALGASFPGLRGSVVFIATTLLASLVRSFCWVGLFCSFGPVSGIVGVEGDEEHVEATVADEGSAEPESPRDALEVTL